MLAQRLLDGQITLSKVDDELRGFNLTRIDMVRLLLVAGKFEMSTPSAGERDFQDDQSKRTVAVLERLLKDRLFGLSTVNYLWDNVGNNMHVEWKAALCTHLTPAGLYALLFTEPSEAFGAQNTGMNPLSQRVVTHIPLEKHADIVALAKKNRKLAALYQMTGWEGCRQQAVGKERDSMMGSDLGL